LGATSGSKHTTVLDTFYATFSELPVEERNGRKAVHTSLYTSHHV
jgi:hypothetical protein